MSSELDYVIVTTISQYRMRYAIPAEALKNEEGVVEPEKAVQLVQSNVADEFSQSHMGEVVVDAAAVSEEGILHIFDVDNAYLSDWPREKKIEWINRWKFQDVE